MIINISISSDHAGRQLKLDIISKLSNHEFEFVDYGDNKQVTIDYPDCAFDVVRSLIKKESLRGILICGTGIGMSIASNRYTEIRAALCYNKNMARLAREHNNANIICLGARTTNLSEAINMVKIFLSTDFLGGRHARRVKKLSVSRKINSRN